MWRVERVHRHLAPAAPSPGAMAACSVLQSPPAPLTDQEVKSFIVDGFLLKQLSDIPREYHLGIYQKCLDERARAEQLPGNGRLQGGHESTHVASLDDFIFPALPELGTIYTSAVLRGAVSSLCGPDYVMHPHRHMHSGMGGLDQNWHKDGHHVPNRHHMPRWIMGMYFCVDTTLEMGPTGLIAGSQYWSCDSQNWSALYTGSATPPADPEELGRWEQATREFQSASSSPDAALRDQVFEQCGRAFGRRQYRAVCAAGSVLFIHFDILHRASRQEPTDPAGKETWRHAMEEAMQAQIAGRARPAFPADQLGIKWRPNFKLQFWRASEPRAAAWVGADSSGTQDSFAFTGASMRQRAVWQRVYDWMKGEGSAEHHTASAAAPSPEAAEAEVSRLRQQIYTLDGVMAEPERVGAAYLLGRGAAAVASFLAAGLTEIYLCNVCS
eukprot:COSAG01_NODE_3338_length_6234_cov_2.176691_2_plen_441_part_00